MRDVEYLLHKGVYRFKALTPKAMGMFLQILEVPDGAGTIHEAFLHAAEDRGQSVLRKLRELGLQTEPDKVALPPPKPLGPPPTHLWDF